MIKVWADTETSSECDLKKHGTAVYAAHPSTRIQLFSYAFDDGPVNLWAPEEGEPMPMDLREAFRNIEGIFHFHNAFFDRNVINHTLRGRYHLPIRRTRCTMAAALAHSLPAGLDDLGVVLGLPQDLRKIRYGKQLVQIFCKPKRMKDGSLVWATPETRSDEWAKYREYCINDTEAMRECSRRTPKWNYTGRELEYWFMDQEINERGMYMDLDFARTAMDAIAEEQAELAKKAKRMTKGEVNAATQRNAILRHVLAEYGIEMDNLKKATVQKIVENEAYPLPLRKLLQVRLDASTTSTAKYKKILDVTSRDSRVRGTIQYCGASRTGRDGGRMVQPQNFPRPIFGKGLEDGERHGLILKGIEAIKGRYAAEIGFERIKLCSSALRYVICAPKNKKLVVSDLSAIEGRALAYLADEEWKIQAYRDADDDLVKYDMYELTYAKSFNVDPATVNKKQRFNGKVLELSMGYAGGVSAFTTFALGYNVNLEKLSDAVTPSIPGDILKQAESFYDWLDSKDKKSAEKAAEKAIMELIKNCGSQDDAEEHGISWEDFYKPKSTHYLPKSTHIAVESLKRMWRQSNPRIVAFWKEIEDAVRSTLSVPNKDFWFGKCYARRSGNWVRIILPSGHNLVYPAMKADPETGQLSFAGIDQFTKKWGRTKTFGGKLCENCIQSFARDVFKFGQLEAEKAGYNVILPVHDELVCEVPDSPEFSVKELERIMSTQPEWALDLPLAAKGFEDYRYHKDLD